MQVPIIGSERRHRVCLTFVPSTTRRITGVQTGGWTATATVVTGPLAKP